MGPMNLSKILLIILLFKSFTSKGQESPYNFRHINNSSFKYWEGVNSLCWRLGVNGDLTYYYYDKYNKRVQMGNTDFIIENSAYALKSDTFLVMALPVVLEEYKI